MKVAVWDTYVKRLDGKVMHFDILVPNDLTDQEQILTFGKDYLKQKTFETVDLSSKRCNFCHIEEATQEIVQGIQTKGYTIIELENCT
ncbi:MULTISPECIES: DUF2024 family protein [unclassified Aureispira]|uniref:DUF2024 family protein n=1 Tax=unclassified Aureispira TaxID=2649989 RepID=UPI000697E171|nr:MULTISPECIES: DUF2024 family protein [unclassified Aureispira]WMX15327.1 DUF2024 family protein [Aureispira sp. CCB-E]